MKRGSLNPATSLLLAGSVLLSLLGGSVVDAAPAASPRQSATASVPTPPTGPKGHPQRPHRTAPRAPRSAPGDILAQFLAPNPFGYFNGRAVAFDGTNLWYDYAPTWNPETHIYEVTTTGSLIKTMDIGVGIGALAWDPGRGKLWGGAYDGTGGVYTIDPSTGATTLQFNFLQPDSYEGYIDGLDYDQSTDTLWISNDDAETVYNVSVTGTILSSFPMSKTGFFNNSGIAVDGPSLWLADPNAFEVVHADKSGNPLLNSFGTPNYTAEDLSYDALTFAPKCALWANEATYVTPRLTAFEVPCAVNVSFAGGWDWGNNGNGELGNGNTANSSIPVQVLNLNSLIATDGGTSHSAALRFDGTVWSWGANNHGQLGDNTLTQRTAPVQVLGRGGVGVLSGITAIAVGDTHTLALKSDGTVWAWGDNRFGELGDHTTTDRKTPVQVVGPGGVGVLSGITAIAANGNHNLALKSDGTVWAWGDNQFGELGNGSGGPGLISTTPVQVLNLSGMTAVAAGFYHSLALKSDGTVWAWGSNGFGELGNGTTSGGAANPVPVHVLNLTSVAKIAAGGGGPGQFSFAMKTDGTVWAWGRNAEGELGVNTSTTCSSPPVPCSTVPVQAPSLTGVTKIAGGGRHALALKPDGTVLAWGFNNDGQLGNGSTCFCGNSTPTQVLNLSGVSDIGAGDNHSLALAPLPPPPPPAAPTNLQAPTVTSSSITLTWQDNATNETGYAVQRQEDGGPFLQVGGTLPANTTTFTDTTVEQCHTYTYQVVAVNAGGESAPSNPVTVTIPGTIPIPPSLVKGTVTGSSVALSWSTSATNVTGFTLQRKTGNGSFVAIGTFPASQTSDIDSSVAPLTDYTYQLLSTNCAGSSPPSNQVLVTTPRLGYTRTEDTDPPVAYTAGWTQLNRTQASGGSVHYATATSATATFTFTGIEVDLVMVRGPQMGKASITVDRGAPNIVDLYTTQLKFRQTVFTQVLSAGTHTITVAPSGQKNPASSGFTVALDAIDTR